MKRLHSLPEASGDVKRGRPRFLYAALITVALSPRIPVRSHSPIMARYIGCRMAYNAWFQCINGCPGEFDLREVIYRCPTCGDLLEVQHDMEALKSRSPAAWIQLFDERYRRNVYPYGSGVWGKKEWVLPFIDNENIVSMYEGNSNLLWADRYGQHLPLETPCANPSPHSPTTPLNHP